MNNIQILKKAGDVLGVNAEEVPKTVKKLLDENKDLQQKINNYK